METKCTKCGNMFDNESAPGLKDVCPKCMAEFLMKETREIGTHEGPVHEPSGKPPIEPGGTFHGMEVLEFIGRGGMGFVYKARQTNLGRVVALKILDPRLAASTEFTERFDREAKALASLNHPNIVQIYDFGKEGEHYFLVMEFVDGTSLRQILSTQRLSPQTALRYVPQICDALEYAHGAGVIHRDIKPENILIDTRGNLKIADFGLAKIAVSQDKPEQVTVTGRFIGTPSYMAPEQTRSAGKVDQRADIYSLGVVFYEMLTGELPIGRFPLPSQQVHVDVRIDDVVLKAMEGEPARRYQRASEVKDDVTKIGDSPGGKTAGVAPAQQAGMRSHRGGGILALGIIGMVACFICGIIAWVMGSNDLKDMKESRMDPAGKGMTQAGKICGMISVFVAIAGLLFFISGYFMYRTHSQDAVITLPRQISTPGDILGKIHKEELARLNKVFLDDDAKARQASSENQKVREKLGNMLKNASLGSVEFEDAIDFLRQRGELEINVHWNTLVAAGIKKEKHLTISMVNITIKKCLESILGNAAIGTEADLDYVIRDGVIEISTRPDLIKIFHLPVASPTAEMLPTSPEIYNR